MTLKIVNKADASSFIELSGVETDKAAIGGISIVQSDDDDLSKVVRSIFLGDAVAANIKVRTVSGDDITFTNVQPGAIIPVQCTRVFDTGTTATSLIGLY